MTISPLTQFRTGSSITKVSADDITIDLRVQRHEGADQRRLAKMAENFNPDALGVLILSRRADNTMVCLDGMHRLGAVKLAGYTRPLDAIVHTDLSVADEAALFLLYNDKKDPSAVSRFRARVVAGDDIAMQIEFILSKHGWRVRAGGDKGSLSAIEATERVFTTAARTRNAGAYPDVLDKVMTVITQAWGHDPVAVNQNIVQGLGQVFGRFEDHLEAGRLAEAVAKHTVASILGKSKSLKEIQGGTQPAAVAKVVTGIYNQRRRTNAVPEWVWTR